MKRKTAVKKTRVAIIRQINFFQYLMAGFFVLASCSNGVNSEPNKEMQQPVIKENDLPSEQRMEWITVLKEWQINEFNAQLKSLGFKQDCVDCSNILWKVVLHIDSEGKCNKVDLIERDVQCAKKSAQQIQELENKVVESFKDKKLGDSFKYLHLEVKIGRASKC